MEAHAKSETAPLRLVRLLVDSAWCAPVFSLSILVSGEVARRNGFFPVPFYIEKIWLASVVLHGAIGISLLARKKVGTGILSISLLAVPCVCFWLIAKQ